MCFEWQINQRISNGDCCRETVKVELPKVVTPLTSQNLFQKYKIEPNRSIERTVSVSLDQKTIWFNCKITILCSIRQIINRCKLEKGRSQLWFYISKSPDAQGRFRPRQVIPRAKGWFGLKSLPRAQPAGVISTQINPMPEGLLDEV